MTNAEIATWAETANAKLEDIYKGSCSDEAVRTLAFDASLSMMRLHMACAYPDNTTVEVTPHGMRVTMTREVNDE